MDTRLHLVSSAPPPDHSRAATHYAGMLSQLRSQIAHRGACAQIAINHLLAAVNEAERADASLPVIEQRIAQAMAELQRGVA